jgi:hypothetical protein
MWHNAVFVGYLSTEMHIADGHDHNAERRMSLKSRTTIWSIKNPWLLNERESVLHDYPTETLYIKLFMNIINRL